MPSGVLRCGWGHVLRPRPCDQRLSAAPQAIRRRGMQVACEFGSGRSAWPMRRRLSNVRHSAEELLWNVGNSIRTSPPVTAVDTALAPVRRRLWVAWRQFGYVWDDFNGEEAKRRWKWSRQREQEAKFWKSFVQFLAMVTFTMVYEALVPVSFLWGAAAPLFISWCLYDRPIMNPIMVGLMLILPYKFIPGAPFRWV